MIKTCDITSMQKWLAYIIIELDNLKLLQTFPFILNEMEEDQP